MWLFLKHWKQRLCNFFPIWENKKHLLSRKEQILANILQEVAMKTECGMVVCPQHHKRQPIRLPIQPTGFWRGCEFSQRWICPHAEVRFCAPRTTPYSLGGVEFKFCSSFIFFEGQAKSQDRYLWCLCILGYCPCDWYRCSQIQVGHALSQHV